jgi:hypothetical protein
VGSRLIYEQSVLAEVASKQALPLEEFVSLPAYVGRESSHDTWYDGHIVKMEIQLPTLGAAASVIIDILGPYWDRIFRCGFHEVSRIEASELNLAGVPENRAIILNNTNDGCVCTFQTFNTAHELRVTFKASEVTRLMLRTPMARVQITS